MGYQSDSVVTVNGAVCRHRCGTGTDMNALTVFIMIAATLDGGLLMLSAAFAVIDHQWTGRAKPRRGSRQWLYARRPGCYQG